MPLTLVTGRANSGKTGSAYDVVRTSLCEGGEPLLIVPNRADEERARRELVAGSPMGVRVRTFDGAVASMWDAGGDGRRIVSGIQRTFLMRRCAETMSPPPPPGLVKLICRMTERLAGAAGEAWRAAEGDGEVGALVSRYAAETVKRGLVEPGEAVDILSRTGEGVPATVVMHRFSELTPAQERFATALARTGRSVTVTLTWEEGFPATDGVTELVGRLSGLGEHRRLPADPSHTPSPELQRIEAELFRPGPPQAPAGDVVFSFAEGDEAEADRIAAEVAALIASGTEPSEVAVVFRAPDRHRAALAHAFDEAGILADHDHAAAFATAPLGRALRSLLSFAVGGDRDDLLGYLRSAHSGADPESVREIEARWRREGTRDRAALVRGVASLGDVPASGVRAVSNGKADGKKWEHLSRSMLVSAHGRPGRATADAEADADACSAVVRVLNGMAEIGEDSVPASEMLALLDDVTLGSGEVERPGRVQVMGAERLKGRRFEAVVLGGLTDDEFPQTREDALGSPLIREVFRSAGAPEPRWGGMAMERALLYDVVTRPRRRLVLSRRTMDSSGSPLGPSVFWEEIRDLYRAPEAETESERVEGADKVLEFGDAGLGEHCSSRRGALRGAVRGAGEARAPRATSARRRAAAGRHGLTEAENLARLASRDTFSASEIETYIKCPYRWFVSRVLRAQGVDFAVDELLLGSVLHDALRDLYQRLAEETGCARVTPATLPAACTLASASLARALGDTKASAEETGHMRARLLPAMLRHLRTDAWSLNGFTPEWREWSFGWPEDGGPARFGGFALRGRVDRIDAAEDGSLVVIDYKKGAAAAPSTWESEGLVQLPLYASVVRERLGAPVVGMFYRGLAKDAVKNYAGPYLSGRVEGGVAPGAALEADEFEALIARAVERSAVAVAGIRAGEIPATGTGRMCDSCSARDYCGRSAK